MNNNILVVFLSCKKNNNLWEKLLNININSIIFYGNPEINEPFIYKNRILTLKCNDTYDFLPVKVYLMIKNILKIPEFNDITHILKIDDWDTKIDNNMYIKLKDINLSDYCGQQLNNKYNGDKRWHFNKCPIDSIWHNKEYDGKFVPWLDGGCGYILSKNAMNIISNSNISELEIYENIIYEDLMIAIILHKNNIYPKHIRQIIIGDK
jgi:hypothetical protein